MLVQVTSGYAQAGLESRAFGGREEGGSSSSVATSPTLPPETWLSQDLLFPFRVDFCIFVSLY